MDPLLAVVLDPLAPDGQPFLERSARETFLGRQAGPFVVLERFHLAIAIVTIIASTVFLLALTVMLVDERRATLTDKMHRESARRELHQSSRVTRLARRVG